MKLDLDLDPKTKTWTNDEQGRPLRWELPSLAVVASDGHDGIVLFYVGAHISSEIEEHGNRQLSDLGLDDAPQGISVWEGKYYWRPSYPEDGDYESKGEFREPTADEWKALQEGRCPWDAERYYADGVKEIEEATGAKP